MRMALAATAMSIGMAASISQPAMQPSRAEVRRESKNAARRRIAMLTDDSDPTRRSRGPAAKPKKKANRLHISRRVRRKHRRARKKA